MKENKRESSVEVGRKYENIAAKVLAEQGYQILQKNYRCCKGEIDIIGRNEGYLCFIEVKYRKSREFGGSLAAVDSKKQKRISAAAAYYLMEKNYDTCTACRFDVAGISENGLELIKNAFEFRK